MELDQNKSLHNYLKEYPQCKCFIGNGQIKETSHPNNKKLSSFNNEELTCNMGKQECKPNVYLCD
jgi:hypothetical protein